MAKLTTTAFNYTRGGRRINIITNRKIKPLIFAFLVLGSIAYSTFQIIGGLSNYIDTFKSALMPLALKSIKSGAYNQIGLDINRLKNTFTHLEDSAVIGYYDEKSYLISGNKKLIARIKGKTEDEWIEHDYLAQYIGLNFSNDGVAIIVKFYNKGILSDYFFYLLSCFGLISIIGLIVRSFSKQKAIMYLNWCFHEIADLIDPKDTIKVLKHRTARAVLLLLGHGKQEQDMPKLTSLLQQLCIGYCPNITIERKYNHKKDMCVQDQLLSLALCNMLKNAKNYTVNRIVKIQSESSKKYLTISVINFVHRKLDSTLQTRILNPYTHDRSGLKLAYAAVKQLGGEITSHFSEKETMLGVKIPLINIEKKFKANESKYSKIPIVAIVDDIKSIRESLERDIKKCGFKTLTFKHVDELYDLLEKQKQEIDLIIVDRYGNEHEEQGMDNWDAVKGDFPESVRYYGFKGPIILVSQASSIPDKALGFSMFLSKQGNHDWSSIIDDLLA